MDFAKKGTLPCTPRRIALYLTNAGPVYSRHVISMLSLSSSDNRSSLALILLCASAKLESGTGWVNVFVNLQ